ncbi:uncharacterized protein EV420DRAFT_1490881 [Desarmillaria tabescens]|uniref:Uncharacterized protein n=1 Tax=Armillaria tabescens TaxID=1929756 RepID=A0AA39IY52_ARMTA|nr:uncharacterized protein EV420DRAFT_1490881 [Desarmillaria tabescens]KAK0431304.1 hypothetical protein EV420DRAFT_1490881 [Desarmillaria tabescens]
MSPFTPASAAVFPLPFPLVPSEAVHAPSPSAALTPLQSNPAALVAQPVQSAANDLLTAGLHLPPSFPQYMGPTGPIVNVRNNRNSTNQQRQQSINACSAFVQNLAMGCNGNQPVVVELNILIDPLCCPNGNCHHPNGDIHADDPMSAEYKILLSDIQPLIGCLQSLHLVLPVNMHKNAECYVDIQKALINHQAHSDTPKIPGFNPDPNAEPDNSGCKVAKESGQADDPGFKSYIMIYLHPSASPMPRVRNCPLNPHTPDINNYAPVLPQSSAMLSSEHDPPAEVGNPLTTQPIHVLASDRSAQRSIQMFIPTHRPRTPPPFICPKWDHPGKDLRHALRTHTDTEDLLVIMAQSIPQAAKVLWHTLLHLGRLKFTLPPDEAIDHHAHPKPPLPDGATVDSWWNPAGFTRAEIHIHNKSAMGNSLLKGTLTLILEQLLDPTHPDSCYSLLPGGSLYLYPRMPVYDLTVDQSAFWWSQGFFLALWILSTQQAPLPLFAPIIHALLAKRIEQCRYQLDQWPTAAINDIDPCLAEFLQPWLDLQKTQPISTHASKLDRLREPVPVFLMEHCAGIVSPSELTFRWVIFRSNAFNALVESPLQSSLIQCTAKVVHKSEFLFIYWLFNRKLESLAQLQPYLNYDNSQIISTEQGKLQIGGDELLADLVLTRFRLALEMYLHKDVVGRGTQLLKTMTSCPYLPASEHDKITFKFVLLDPNSDIKKPSGSKLLYNFVHACWSSTDIGFNGHLVQLLATG